MAQNVFPRQSIDTVLDAGTEKKWRTLQNDAREFTC